MRFLMQATVACLIVIGLAGCGGFDQSTETFYKSQVQIHDAQKDQVDRMIKEIEGALDDKEFASVKDQWASVFAQAKKHISAADTDMSNAENIFKTDNKHNRSKLYSATKSAAEKRTAAKNSVDKINTIYQYAKHIIADPEGTTGQYKRAVSRVANYNLSSINANLDEASSKYPEKSSWANKTKSELDKIKATAKQALSTLDNGTSIQKAYAVSNANEIANGFNVAINNTNALLAQLDVSWTKTLSDMEIVDNGSRVTFQHKYEKITIKDGQADKSETWVDVSETVFEQNENNLGMAIENKPLGKFDNEASKVAQHAGYNYMAQPGQSNQYGTWRTDNSGNSFWEFYGQYAFMSAMLWGPSYSPIYVSDYRDYRRSYDSGRPYYGSTSNGRSRYGTSGTYTANRYSNSKYRTSPTVSSYRTYRAKGGSASSGRTSFSSSRYSSTGRAAAARSSSSGKSSYSGSSYRSSSSGGSRSSGGK